MADNYETITVLTHIPVAAVSPLHRALLEAIGFGVESDGDALYLYAEDSINSLPEMDDVEVFLERPLTDEEKNLPIVQTALDDGGEGWATVLQTALKTDAMRTVPHIDVMASFTCSKARPGEHGGWSMRIDRERIRSCSTQEAFTDWDREEQFVLDLEQLCNVATRSRLSNTEQNAAARIQDYIVNHPVIANSVEANG